MSMWRRRPKYNCKAYREDKHVHRGPDRVDILTFKYKEMCKMDSSSDSESDASPRWSDTSSKGNVSGAAERRAAQKLPSLTHKPTGWHNVCIDPYDGSSEDSCSSMNGSRRPKKGTCRFWGKFRRGTAMHGPLPKEAKRSGTTDGAGGSHFGDIHMSSDSEIDFTNQNGNWPSSDVKDSKAGVLEDSGVFTRSPSDPPGPALSTVGGDCVRAVRGSSNENDQETPTPQLQSPDCTTGYDSLSKRKLVLPQGEMGYWHRKRQCMTKVEEESHSPE
ncbi:uncharacterized protein LOC105908299 [Clupea harengus]|uniref:Uncharacterized protein LOC105908299 n=1 Tax=Clupea harengus TaxID=7950 RepID=A0A6P3W8D9_CLUHA|nr:uncharacterized protein LOC105908299 [Clupea harengus]